MTTTVDNAAVEPEPPSGPVGRPSAARPRVALGLALVALAAAIVGAIGPAKEVSAAYTWPPSTLPSGRPSTWYTPLVLEQRTPQKLDARFPCGTFGRHGGTRPITVFATARHPRRSGGLAVVRRPRSLSVAIGTRPVTLLSVESSADRTCAYRLTVRPGRLTIAGGPVGRAPTTVLAAMPVVTGLFTELDLPSRPGLEVHVETQPFTTTAVTRQTMAWLVAAVAILCAFALLLDQRPRPIRAAGRLVRSAARNLHWADACVVLTLLGWWILSPAFADDGWVHVRQSMYASARGLSNYYNGFGTFLPNGFWLEWSEHWLFQATASLVVLRLPALGCLLAAWAVSRWVLARCLGPSVGASSLATWTLAATFLVGVLSWGMTLRPEPVTELFVVGVLAACTRFVEREAASPLVIAAVFIPFAMTAHHEGIVALAPLLVISPRIATWVRAHVSSAVAIGIASLALLVLLFFVDSDLQQRRLQAQSANQFVAGGTTWLDEIQRYVDAGNSTPIRAASVALMWLAVIAFLLRASRRRSPLLDLPASTLAVGLLLLVPLPDKWKWHFGALIGIAAVAVAAEAARLGRDATNARAWQARPLLVIGTGVVASVWVWGSLEAWSILDLRTFDWSRTFHRLQISSIVIAAPLVVMLGASILGMLRRDESPWRVPWRVAPWIATFIGVPTIVFTIGVLAADSLATSTWTLARQNVAALVGHAGCGVADEYLVASPESSRPLPVTPQTTRPRQPAWLPPAPEPRLQAYPLGPSADGVGVSPWFPIAKSPVGVFVNGSLGLADSLLVLWGRSGRDGIVFLHSGQVDIPGTPTVSSSSGLASLGTTPWRMFTQSEFPTRPDHANAIRLELRSGSAPGATLAVTTPVTYSTTRLTHLVQRGGVATLVMPHLAPYVPCARAPQLHDGVAETPAYIVSNPPLKDVVVTPVRYPSSPFLGILDLYSASYLPVANLDKPITNIVVFRVNRHIPGAVVVPPTVTTSS